MTHNPRGNSSARVNDQQSRDPDATVLHHSGPALEAAVTSGGAHAAARWQRVGRLVQVKPQRSIAEPPATWRI